MKTLLAIFTLMVMQLTFADQVVHGTITITYDPITRQLKIQQQEETLAPCALRLSQQ